VSTSLRAFVTSFLVNLLILTGMLLFAAPWLGPVVTLIATGLIALTAGALLGRQMRDFSPRSLAIGALCAAFVLSVPVILATYGLALAGLPLPLLYALCVGAGAHTARKRAC
jgi:hypothetical protein